MTVFKTSDEHQLILDAGAYDVSARLLQENLKVDDGWVCRKNPEIVVKIVSRNILGGGVLSAAPAAAALQALINRLAAGLVIAKTANPEAYADVNLDQALSALTVEATGAAGEGLYYLRLSEL